MARVLVIEDGDDWRAIDVPEGWDADDLDRYLGGMAYGRAAMLTVEPMEGEPDPLRVALDEATELMEGDAVDAAVVLYRAVCAHLGLPESHLADEQARMDAV